MIAHIVTVKSTQKILTGAYYVCGRAVAILREQNSDLAGWICSGTHRNMDDRTMILELIAPNDVKVQAVLAAVNEAITLECPWLKSLDWETLRFCSISCMNQDQ
jgi:hypothetical protein